MKYAYLNRTIIPSLQVKRGNPAISSNNSLGFRNFHNPCEILALPLCHSRVGGNDKETKK
jgi:hypothetical protein